MTVFDVSNTSEIGRPANVFDANGLEWPFVINCDTESGRIEKFVADEYGIIQIAPNGEEAIRETIIVASPLHVHFVETD